jgi:hypothetical protein
VTKEEEDEDDEDTMAAECFGDPNVRVVRQQEKTAPMIGKRRLDVGELPLDKETRKSASSGGGVKARLEENISSSGPGRLSSTGGDDSKKAENEELAAEEKAHISGSRGQRRERDSTGEILLWAEKNPRTSEHEDISSSAARQFRERSYSVSPETLDRETRDIWASSGLASDSSLQM